MKSHRNDLFSKPERAFKQPSLLSLNGREWSVARLSTDMIHYSIFIEKSCQSSFLQRFSEQKFHRFLPSKIAALLAAAKVGLRNVARRFVQKKNPASFTDRIQMGAPKKLAFLGKRRRNVRKADVSHPSPFWPTSMAKILPSAKPVWVQAGEPILPKDKKRNRSKANFAPTWLPQLGSNQ